MPEPVQSNETVIRSMPLPEEPATSRKLDLSEVQANVEAPGSAYDDEEEHTRAVSDKEKKGGEDLTKNRGYEYAIGALLLVVGLGFGVTTLLGPSKPGRSELATMFPYTNAGAKLPNGQVVPAADSLTYDFIESATCNDEPCLKYLAHQPGSRFQLQMDLHQVDGRWRLMSAHPPAPDVSAKFADN